MREVMEALCRFHPVPWELIPDLGLYMDQVVTFITRMVQPLYGEATDSYLSPSMINNYVKAGLVPRPVGKKYNRDQIALLTMIVVLKQSSSMQDIARMIHREEGETVEALYEGFCQRLDHAIKGLQLGDAGDAPHTALDYAILSAAYSAGCAAILKALELESGGEPQKKKKEKKD